MMNQKGMTIIDILIGVALMALLGGLISSTNLFVNKQFVNLKNDMDDSIDSNLAERMLFSDLAGLEPSFNNLKTVDDSGYGFFDYYPDVPANSVRTPLTREAVLSIPKQRLEFYVVIQDIKAGALLNYEPSSAYEIGDAPDDFNQAATLTFDSINKKNWVAVQRPNFWVDEKLLLVDTPARVRPVTSTGNINMSVLPRSPIFIGRVSGKDLAFDNHFKTYFNVNHPDSGAEINTLDKFFRDLPSVGGGQPLVRIRAVRLIRYYLEPYEDQRLVTKPSRLYKSEFVNGKFSDPFLMADKVDRLVFKRDSVLKRMMYFKLIKAKNKK
jgi:hypothetical protein